MSNQWLSVFSILVGLIGAAAALIPFFDAKKKNGKLNLSYSFALLSHERFTDICRKSWRASTVVASISYLSIAFGDKIPGLDLQDGGIGNLIILPIVLMLGTTAFQGLLMTNLAFKEFKPLDNYLNRYNYSVAEYIKDALWVSWVFGTILLIGLDVALDFGTNNFYRLTFLAQLTASFCSCSSAYTYAYVKYRTMHKVTKVLIVTRNPIQTFDNLVELRREDDEYVALLQEKDCTKIVAIPIDNISLVKKTLDAKSLLLDYHLSKGKENTPDQ